MTERVLVYVPPGNESVSASLHQIIRLVDTSAPPSVRLSSSISEAVSGRYVVIDTSTWGKTPPATGDVLAAFKRLGKEHQQDNKVIESPPVEHLYNQSTALADIWRIIMPYLQKK